MPEVARRRRTEAQRGRPDRLDCSPCPALVVYVVFLVYPALQSLWFSFTNWDGLSATYDFVGLNNYAKMAKDPVVIQAMINNLIWTVVTITVPVVLGLLLAILLNGKVRGKPVLRLVFYTPAVMPLVAVASIWGWMYNPQYGAINEFLNAIGLGALAEAVARSGLHRTRCGDAAGHLAPGRLPDAALLSRTAGHQRRHVRGGHG